MSVLERSRTLRPKTRQPESPYKVDTKNVGPDDVLRLTIYEEGDVELAVFEFSGSDLADRSSIHFSAKSSGGHWKLTFSGAKPVCS